MRLRNFPPVERHKLGTVKMISVATDNFGVFRGEMSQSQVGAWLGCCCKIHFSSDQKKKIKNTWIPSMTNAVAEDPGAFDTVLRKY